MDEKFFRSIGIYPLLPAARAAQRLCKGALYGALRPCRKKKRERAMKALPKYKGNGKNNGEGPMAGNGHGPKMEKQPCCPKCKQPVTL